MSQPIEIIVPRLGWSMEQGAFVAWHKNEGEFVKAGEVLFSIEGDKSIQEIESIDSGILHIAPNGPKPGDSIRVGDVLGYLLSDKESARPGAPVIQKEVHKEQPNKPYTTESAPSVAPTTNLETPRKTISPRALRIAAELGVEWTALHGTGRGGRIRERDVRSAAPFPHIIHVPTATEPVVLVTGGCGFIGTWVIRELLERGLRVVALDASEKPARWHSVIGAASETVPLVRGSLLNRELLAYVFAAHKVTHLIHLAALLTPACHADPWEGCQINVLGTVALFEQLRKSPTPLRGFSYASSIAVFDEDTERAGSEPGDGPPPTFYGAFKRSVELIAEQYWRHFGISSLGIRPQVAYGPERDSGLTAGPSLAARAAARGESFCIGYTGRVGYDYVEDIARAFVRGALETPSGAQFADLPGQLADVMEVVTAIDAAAPGAAAKLTINGSRVPTHISPKPHLISALFPDWRSTPLSDGIRRTVEFYKNRKRPAP